MSDHEMKYRAGSRGLGHLGIPDGPAGWYCTCTRWRFSARAMPSRKTGNNSIEAHRSYAAHVKIETCEHLDTDAAGNCRAGYGYNSDAAYFSSENL